jgi:hypothetical protein
MVLPRSADHQASVEARFQRRLFTRRADLTDSIRLAIGTDALHAMMHGVWGTITNLADKYEVSRPFVYSLAATLREAGEFLFGEIAECGSTSSLRERSIAMMLSLRMEARSSIGAISTVMSRFAFELSSTGSVSQQLSRIGGWLPTGLSHQGSLILAHVSMSLYQHLREYCAENSLLTCYETFATPVGFDRFAL